VPCPSRLLSAVGGKDRFAGRPPCIGQTPSGKLERDLLTTAAVIARFMAVVKGFLPIFPAVDKPAKRGYIEVVRDTDLDAQHQGRTRGSELSYRGLVRGPEAVIMKFGSAVVLIFVVVLAAAGAARATDTWETLCPGVTHLHRTTTSPYHWNIHVVKVDLTNPRVRIRVVKKQDSNQDDCGETTSSMCRRYGALVGINTDFFLATWPHSASHQPQGYCVTDGLVTNPNPIAPTRHVLQFSAGNGQAVINVPTGVQSWWYNCTAGGPRILRDGVVSIENESGLPNVYNRDPYTACALSQDGKTLILLVEDGRCPGVYDGMTGPEIAQVLLEMGGYQAIMFDGGGSTTMAINGTVVNSPSDGSERKVAAALCVIDEAALPNPAYTPYQTGFENPTFPLGNVNGIDGWSKDGGGSAQIVSSPNHSGSQALQISGAGASHYIGTMGSQSVTWIDVWMLMTSKQTGILYANSAGGSCSQICFASDGKIKYLYLYPGTTTTVWVPLMNYSTNTWYRITLREDFHLLNCSDRINPLGFYSLYINGVLQMSGVGFCSSGASTEINQVRFEHSGGGYLLVDDLCVSNIEPRHWSVGASQARNLPDGSAVEIAGPIVTSSFADACYVENADRTGAIKLTASSVPAVGSKVNAVGRVATVSGEKTLQCNYLRVVDTGVAVPRPLRPGLRELTLMRPDNLPAGIGAPLSGMSVRVDGKIVRIESDRFYIDDGGAPNGVPVLYGGMSGINLGKHAVVDGCVAAYLEPIGWVTAIRPPTSGGVRIL